MRPSHKEYPYRNTSERGVKHDIAASEPAAVLLQLELFPKFHKSGSREVSVFGVVFCLAVVTDLYHAGPMAFNVAAMDEPDNLLVRKPAVRQYVSKLYASADSPLYHLFCEFYLGHVVFILPLTEYIAVMFGGVAPFEFFGTHAVVAFLPLLPHDCEIKKNLGNSIGDSHTKTFES